MTSSHRSILIGLSAVVFFTLAGPVEAHSTVDKDKTASSAAVFRLQVSGPIPVGMTFWVAYGPLGGRFGILQLRRSSPGLFAVATHLPAGRSSFAFIAGYGVLHTRAGPAPGNPLVTIRLLTRTTALRAARTTVQWQAPIG